MKRFIWYRCNHPNYLMGKLMIPSNGIDITSVHIAYGGK